MEEQNVKGLRFFRVLLPNFSSKLLLPCNFINEIKGNGKDKATLLSPHGQMWDVLCYEEHENVYMGGESWLQFTSANNLKVGYFLVFHHKGNMVFSFRAFDLSTRETAYSSSPTQSCERKKAEIVADNIIKEEDYNIIEQFEEPFFKKRKGDQEKKEDSFKARFELIVQSCNLSGRRCFVKIPERILRSCDRLKWQNEVTVEDPSCREWSVGLQHCNGSHTVYISKGWLEFARANGLKEGDRCFFELASQAKNHLTMKAKIIHTIQSGPRIKPLGARTTSNRRNYKSVSSFTATIKPYHLQRNYMHIPLGLMESNGLGGCSELSLRDYQDQMWLVGLVHLKDRHKTKTNMSKGWLEFAHANELKEGDRCIFNFESQAENHIMKVKIVRNTPFVNPIFKPPNIPITSNCRNDGSFSSFMTTIKPYNLNSSFMYIPIEFVECNGLERCSELCLKDSKDRMWLVGLAHKKGERKQTYISKGWLEFARTNELKGGDRCIFELVSQAKNHVMKVKVVQNTPIVHPIKHPKIESTSNGRNYRIPAGFMTIIKPYNLKSNFMYIPLEFVESNGLDRCSALSLKDSKDRMWLVGLTRKRDREKKLSYISKGWLEFASANEVKEGDRCIFELESVAKDNHILKVKIEQDNPIVTPINPPKSQATSICGNYKSFSSFMTTIKPYNLNYMHIPPEFLESNGLERCSEMRLKDSKDQIWLVGLALRRDRDRAKKRTYISSGWRDFARSNNLGAGDVCIFEMAVEEKGNVVHVHVQKRLQLN